jgi:hypothetical protein
MRVLLLALMIALLPVRGWVGHAMAVDMAAQQAQAASMLPASSDTSAMSPDCPMHAHGGGGETPAEAHCSSCNTCQLCLALASFVWPSLASAPPVPHAEPLGGGDQFSSAEGLASLKPPIS